MLAVLTVLIFWTRSGDETVDGIDENGDQFENGDKNGLESSSDSSDNDDAVDGNATTNEVDDGTTPAAATNGGEKKKPRASKPKDKNTKKKRTRKKTKKSSLMRRNIRHLITDENLTETTKEARVSGRFLTQSTVAKVSLFCWF